MRKDHICRVEKKTALLFSLEMSCKQITERLISLEGRVDSRKIREGKLQSKDWDDIIADELESTVEDIKPIYDAVIKHPADTDPKKILAELK